MTFDLSPAGAHADWPSLFDDFSDDEPDMTIGDRDIRTTYAAMGEALGGWQEFELALATLYARFRGYPNWLDKVRQFGACNVDAAARLEAIAAAADCFFTTRDDPASKAAFDDLCEEAAILAIRHQRIAQGLVRNVAGLAQAPRFALELPWHAHDRARLNMASLMESEALLESAAAFRGLAAQAEAIERACAARTA